jgi:D-beta-D-heptose 7-phosphate kinase/D-beta-D-heptose 1-phosphate adenosyltransferase
MLFIMLISQELALQIAAEARKRARRIVFTNGCFDILHVGHVRYLEAAKALGDILIVGLNSDASTRRLKGNAAGALRPVNSQEDRADVLCGLKSVDFVCIFDDDTPLQLILALQPDVLVKGGDYTVETVVGAREAPAWGGRVEIIPFVEGKSTSRLIERILG